MAKPLTVRTIESAKPRADRFEISDGGCRGLRLVVQPSGAKSWAFRYRSPINSKPSKLTIGPYPEISLADARKRAVEALQAVIDSRDPCAEKRQRRHAAADQSDLVEVLLRAFIAGHIEQHNRDRTAEESKRIIRLHIEPAWKGRKVGTITKRDVIALLESVAERAPIASNRTFAVVRKFFAWLIERSIIEVSPTTAVKPLTPEKSRDRVLTSDEIRALWAATAESGPLAAMVRLLLLTGQRRTEVAGMRWSEIHDLDGIEPVWVIPPERSKNGQEHTVPLTAAAVAIIKAQRRIANSPFVLTTTGRTPVSGFSRFKESVDDAMLSELKRAAQESGQDPERVALPDWRLHDLRRTVASGIARLGEPVEIAERVLNHTSGTFAGIVSVYQRYSFAKEKRRALEKWATEVDRIISSAEPASNVVQLRAV